MANLSWLGLDGSDEYYYKFQMETQPFQQCKYGTTAMQGWLSGVEEFMHVIILLQDML